MTTSPIKLADLDGTDGFRIDGVASDDDSGFSVSAAGDVNGDGIADVIVGGIYASPDGEEYAGSSYVVFGTDQGFGPALDLGSLDGTDGFRLDGAKAFDLSGASVSSAGDVNGDGIDDVIVGAPFASPDGNTNAGSSYVVFGTDQGFGPALDLGSLDGTNGFRLDGIAAYDVSGTSVSSAGDVNGDGIADVIVGAPYGGDDDYTGSSYVVFGRDKKTDGSFAAGISLADLDGTNGFRLDIAAGNTAVVTSVSSAGDVNGDSIHDVIIGTPVDRTGNSDFPGSSYVVFGRKDGKFDAEINLGALDGANGFSLNSDLASFYAGGFSVSSAGDVNGDGIDDVVVGAPLGTPDGTSATFSAGSSFVVFGTDQNFGADIDLGSLNGTNGFRIDGAKAYDTSGASVSSAGDVNGDGIDDVMVAAPFTDPDVVEYDATTKSIYVVFGKDTKADGEFVSDISLAEIDGTNGFRLDGAGGEFNQYRPKNIVSAAGDVNGDGVDDVIVGAPNSRSSYVVFGASDIIQGTEGPDSLEGSDSADEIAGLGGDDTLLGKAGDDTIGGDADDDILEGGPGADSLDGGAGTDTARYAAAEAGVTASLVDPSANTGEAAGDTYTSIENLTGSDFADTLTGDENANALTGGAGADSLEGGAGTDTAVYAGSDAGVNVDLSAGTGSGGDAEGDTLTGIENVDGSANADTLTGDDDANVLSGGAGADSLDGGSGNDTLQGGGGADTLQGGAGEDGLEGGAGIDRAIYSGSLTAASFDYDSQTGSWTVTSDGDTDTLDSVEVVVDGDGDVFHLAGAGSYATLNIAVLSASPGDTVLIGQSFSEIVTVSDNITLAGVNDDAAITVTGGLSNALRLSGGPGTTVTVDGVGLSADADAVLVSAGASVDVSLRNLSIAAGGDGVSYAGLGDLSLDAVTVEADGTGVSVDPVGPYPGTVSIVDSTLSTSGQEPGSGLSVDAKDFAASVVLSNVTIEGDDRQAPLIALRNLADGSLVTDGSGGPATATLSSTVSVVTVGIGGTKGDLDLSGFTVVSDGPASIAQLVGLVDGAGTYTGTAERDFAEVVTGYAADMGDGDDLLVVQLDTGSETTALDGGSGTDGLAVVNGVGIEPNPDPASVELDVAGGTFSFAIDRQGATQTVSGENFEEFVYDAGSGGDTFDVSEAAAAAARSVFFEGGAGDDSASVFPTESAVLEFFGSSGDDSAFGGAGEDTLSGEAGDDSLTGGAGADILAGGTGIDTAGYASAGTGVTASLADSSANTGEADGDTYTSIENLTGSAFADTLTGDENANALSGGDGDDSLTGGAGADGLDGGTGIDRAVYADTLTASDFAYDGAAGVWTVATATEGTDGLEGVEVVEDGEGTVFRLAGTDGYATLQAAIDAAAPGETVLVGETYAENVTVSEAITLAGVGGEAGVAGGDGIAVRVESVSGGSVRLEGLALTSGADAVSVAASVAAGIALADGTVTADGRGVVHGGTGDLTLTGTTVTAGPAGVTVRPGGLDGTEAYTGTLTLRDTTLDASGTDPGAGLIVEARGGEASVILDGVSIDGDGRVAPALVLSFLGNGALVSNGAGGPADVAVTGATGALSAVRIDRAKGDLDLSGVTVDGTALLDTWSDVVEPVDGSGAYTGSTGSDRAIVVTGYAADTGAGDDQLIVGLDRFVDTTALDGGEGTDELYVTNGVSGAPNANPTTVTLDETDGVLSAQVATGIEAATVSGRNFEAFGYAAGEGGDTFGMSEAASAAVDAVYVQGGPGADSASVSRTGEAILWFDGFAGEDSAFGGAGGDVLSGGEGDDLLVGNAGADILDGGEGSDTASYASAASGVTADLADAGNNTGEAEGDTYIGIENFIGSEFADTLLGTDAGQEMAGLGGDDIIAARGGDDSLFGGVGDDVLFAADGADLVRAGAGDDVARGGAGADTLSGEAGNDTLVGDGGDDEIVGDAGEDLLKGSQGADTLRGGAGEDVLAGQAGGDRLEGGEGADRLFGGDGADLSFGQAGDDFLKGGGGDDTLRGLKGDDRIAGDGGDDFLAGGLNDDRLFGGDGDDRLFGQRGRDVLDGQAGDDRLAGGEGTDALKGGAGADTLRGGEGRDFLNGGAGDDVLVGGDGPDRYKFTGAFGDDVIAGFTSGEDRVDLRAVAGNVTSFDELVITENARGDAVVDIGEGTVTFLRLAPSDLGADDFLV